MKIIFNKYVGKLPNITYQPILYSSFYELLSAQENAIDKYSASIFEALKRNKYFLDEVSKVRKEFDIPSEGYDLETWTKIKNKNLNNQLFRDEQIKIEKKSRALKNKFKIPFRILHTLKDIVLHNAVFTPIEPISLRIQGEAVSQYFGPYLSISIQAKISQRQMLDFIKDKKNWKRIEKELDKFKQNEVFISQRDFLIYDLKSDNPNFTYEEIANILVDRYPKFSNIETSTITKSFSETSKKILSLNKV